MKIFRISLTVLFSWALLAACDDIFEVTDISDESVPLLAPGDQSVVMDSLVNFNWDGVDGAEAYLVQIATPNFDGPSQLVLDTLLPLDSTYIGNRITKRLAPNDYEWRVRAENTGSATDFSAHRFTVEGTGPGGGGGSPDISNVQVVLVAPTNGSSVSGGTVNFNWEPVEGASSYEVQVATPDFGAPAQISLDTILVVDSTFVGTRVSKALSANDYIWRVRARNSGSRTPFSMGGFTVEGNN